MDLQPFYPQHLVPTAMKRWFTNYLIMSRDPLVGGVVGNFGDSAHLAWFKTFLYLEFIFQTPIFVIAMYALYYNKRTYYPLLAIYGAQSATTTLACLVHLVQTPESTPAIIKAGLAGITNDQRMLLLGGYTPFFLGALVVAIDFGWRSAKLIHKAVQIEEEGKWK
ncbi:transmembrane protein 6/97 [Crepidotus variabilis]|uniref:Efficient mitochondria targeting-associated protein 19 n=1 Tax=Crepidotus variabilis TaxID=179855 RepID=A0A9P6EAG8_9AGAR|nr:transmembrane protein 6/97 [Crepidotus variabilis]